jgi:predicted anti-sigma-YlaC factor YlaD
MHIRSATCESAREFVSLQLDGELSRLERAILSRHLDRCASCAESARRTTVVAELLRSAQLEDIRLPTDAYRRHRHLRRMLVGVAATGVAVVGGALLGISVVGREHSRFVPSAQLRTSGNVSGRFDWAAGVPRSPQVVQFVPGGRFTFDRLS